MDRDKSIDDLLDDYLAGRTGKLVDPSATAAPAVPDSREGKLLEVTGIAERAMEGAVVVEEGGSATYVEGLDNWPPELYRKRVTVRGTLRRRRSGAAPGVAADGGAVPATHGATGSSRVLVGATWKLAE